MIKTRNLKISINSSLTANVIGIRDVNWYIDSIFRPFFYEYLEHKPSKESDKIKIKAAIVSLVNEYKLNNPFNSDIRLVLKLNSVNVGGVTLIKNKDDANYIEIAYWVLPEYQRLGICRDAINKIMTTLKLKYSSIEGFKLTILSNNYASIKLAEKLGFEVERVEKSKLNEKIDKITYIKHSNK